jgi:hypothetical protein
MGGGGEGVVGVVVGPQGAGGQGGRLEAGVTGGACPGGQPLARWGGAVGCWKLWLTSCNLPVTPSPGTSTWSSSWCTRALTSARARGARSSAPAARCTSEGPPGGERAAGAAARGAARRLRSSARCVSARPAAPSAFRAPDGALRPPSPHYPQRRVPAVVRGVHGAEGGCGAPQAPRRQRQRRPRHAVSGGRAEGHRRAAPATLSRPLPTLSRGPKLWRLFADAAAPLRSSPTRPARRQPARTPRHITPPPPPLHPPQRQHRAPHVRHPRPARHVRLPGGLLRR